MKKILLAELNEFLTQFKKLDTTIVAIFLSSSVLLTISWYFSTPKFFNENFIFHKVFELKVGDLLSFTYWFLFDIILFLIIPFIIIKFYFKEKVKNYGISLGERAIGFSISAFSILIFFPVIYFISASENFSQYFPLMQSAKDDLLIFLIYEILFVLFIFSWEFIFRGFMLFGLEKKFGIYSTFIQMIPFVILHFDKPFFETISSIFGGVFLGYLALRTRSIIYGFFIHAIILVTLDVLSFFRG